MEDGGFSPAVAISIVIGIIIFIIAVVLLVLFFCKEKGKKSPPLSRSFIFWIPGFDFFFPFEQSIYHTILLKNLN